MDRGGLGVEKEITKNVTDYLTTFFVGNRIFTKLLSEVVNNRNNQNYLEALGLPSNTELFIFCEERFGVFSYVLQPKSDFKVVINGNEEIYESHAIENGDYITISTKEVMFKVLFISLNRLNLGYRKYLITSGTNIFIGRAQTNDVTYSFSNFFSREKQLAIRIDKDGNGYVEDLKRTLGVYVNGVKTNSQELHIFDEVYVLGLSIVYMGDFIAVRDFMLQSSLELKTVFNVKPLVSSTIQKEYYVTTPRILKSLECEDIVVDSPPNKPTVDGTPAILVLGPSVTMATVMLASIGVSIGNAISGKNLAALIASSVMAVGMLAGAIMWPMLLRSYQKKKVIADESFRKERYMAYINDIEKLIKEKNNKSITILNKVLCPSPDFLTSIFDSEKNRLRLWERNFGDEDFLRVRLGLGNRVSNTIVKFQRKGFRLHEDVLENLPSALAEKYRELKNVPLTLDIFNNRAIGMIGNEDNTNNALNSILLNIISLHSPEDVKVIIVASHRNASKLNKYKNIPHIWSDDRRIRFFATNKDEVRQVFRYVDDVVRGRENLGEGAELPYFICIVIDDNLIEKEILEKYVDGSLINAGMTAILAYGDIVKLPKCCKTIIQCTDNNSGYYTRNENSNKFISYSPDKVDEQILTQFLDQLSGLKIKQEVHRRAIANSVSFLHMFKAGNVKELRIEEKWDNNNSAKSLAVPIGLTAGNEVFYLDIHEKYHGAHGLVAGTTGSGKSEFLQALILSLAINYSPNEVGFVLIDFKGGDMARPFMPKEGKAGLPHLAATISNLSGNILYRAVVSLKAEIEYRQNLFNESAIRLGIDKIDINSYHKYYKNGYLDIALPHLVVIIDEFAQLKLQQPDFLVQLVNIAQVGRSLGIHLILATQKPSGIVDPQIMSNSRFKVCLKVADKQDSTDILGKADAAMIKNPGRLFLQVGYDELYECIQSAYSGAEYIPTSAFVPDNEITVHLADNTATSIHSEKLDVSIERTGKSQLESIVAVLSDLGGKKNLSAKRLWLDVLPQKLCLIDVNTPDKGLCIASVGLVDLVRKQKQLPFNIDFTQKGNIAVYGSAGTGKTTFLHTLVYSMVGVIGYAPKELNIFAMDFGGRNLGVLSLLPHTMGIAFAEEEENVIHIIDELTNIIDSRKILFAKKNCSTFVEFRNVQDNILPAVVVLIDNMEAMRNKYIEHVDKLVKIISIAKTYGIYFVITGLTRNAIYWKIAEHISMALTFKMNDSASYFDIHNIRTPLVPEEISGRGITVIDKDVVEFQIAVTSNANTQYERMNILKHKYETISNTWSTNFQEKSFCETEQFADNELQNTKVMTQEHDNILAPIDDIMGNLVLGESLLTNSCSYGISLEEDYKLCICANGDNNLKYYLSRLLSTINKYEKKKIIFFDDVLGKYQDITSPFDYVTYIKGEKEFESNIPSLKNELNSRLSDKNQCCVPLFIVVPEFNQFFNMITDEQAGLMRKIMQLFTSPAYKVVFICGFDTNGKKNNDRLYLELIVNSKNFIISPCCYDEALLNIETLPLIRNIENRKAYVCLKDKIGVIRW